MPTPPPGPTRSTHSERLRLELDLLEGELSPNAAPVPDPGADAELDAPAALGPARPESTVPPTESTPLPLPSTRPGQHHDRPTDSEPCSAPDPLNPHQP